MDTKTKDKKLCELQLIKDKQERERRRNEALRAQFIQWFEITG
jgi:hypothetical protein